MGNRESLHPVSEDLRMEVLLHQARLNEAKTVMRAGSHGIVSAAPIIASLLAASGVLIPISAKADYHQLTINSVEWLVDTSDAILVVESKEETVKASVPKIVQVLKGTSEGIEWPLRGISTDEYSYLRPRADGKVRLLFVRGESELLEKVSLVREWSHDLDHRFYGVTQMGDLLLSPSALVAAVKDRLEVQKGTSPHIATGKIAAPPYFPLETTAETYMLRVPLNSHLRDEYVCLLRRGDAAQCMYAIYGLSRFHDEATRDALRRATKMESVLPSYRRVDGGSEVEVLTVGDVRRKAEEVLAELVASGSNLD